MRILTIGFTRKSAQQFFEFLTRAGARRVVDVRLNNVSQLAGFAKKNDLAYFLNQLCHVDYVHAPELAPTKAMLEDACLLCSEDKPHQCHRRLVAEYLKDHWGDVEIDHLG